MKIIDKIQTCSACPSQWDFITDDNRIGYIRYRWGSLEVRLTVPFDIIVDNISLIHIIKYSWYEYIKSYKWWGLKQFIKKIIPHTFKNIKELFTNIYKYWFNRDGYSKLYSVSDIPKLCEFEGVKGIEVLYKNIDESGWDGFIEWEDIEEILLDVDMLSELKIGIDNYGEDTEAAYYRKKKSDDKNRSKQLRKEIKNIKKIKWSASTTVENNGLIEIVPDENKTDDNMSMSELQTIAKDFNDSIEERKKKIKKKEN